MRAEIQVKLLENLLDEITKRYDSFIKEQNEKIEDTLEKATKDPLTHLYNREFLSEYAEKVLKENRRKGESIALIFLDLDNFKPVNDNYGHEEGDKVLKNVAEMLKNSFRDQDIVVRYGGDEFIVFAQLNRVQVYELNEVLKSLQNRIEDNFQKYGISISYGISIYPLEANNLEVLIYIADKKMYEQKKRKKLDEN
ncbi:GGDEF domain-containing protein [Hydrogenimonas thermophila]|uniref:GGDEF domain-containing protein n=1 Tax=Hydrogenimonas thermophila TaxID=223786 RepID=UPI0029371CED|nr:GGDEF domain-containing protein [Hydrogenimonas thermophila]WOE70726.1 GGDEF domain-containing protein [Hydrogenimonas thermophila]WOE73244.1 GGDEF domain-containing protein [Hydrogenimonas thermophila]